MYQTLVPCPSCARHILAAEEVCPFCEGTVPRDLAAAAVPSATQRMSRAAAFVFGASLAVTACGSEGGGTGGAGGTTGSTTTSTVDDDGGAMALYGVPAPEDAGTDAPDDDGGNVALYGVPPPMDAG